MGVKEWAKDVPWPFSDDQFDQLSDIVFDAFDDVYVTLDDKRKAIFLASISHVAGVVQDLHFAILDSLVTTSGRSLTWHEKASGVPYRQFVSQRRVSMDAKTVWLTRARQLTKNTLFNRRHLCRPVSLYKDCKRTWSLGSFSQLKARYLERQGGGCRHVYPAALLAKSNFTEISLIDTTAEEAIRAVLDLVVKEVKGAFGIYVDVSGALARWTGDLVEFESIYDKTLGLRDIPKTLLLSEMGFPAHKLIAVALRSRGATIVGFHHGSNIGMFAPRTFFYRELFICDRYICPTEKIARLHQQKLDMTNLQHAKVMTFESANNNPFSKIARQQPSEPNRLPPKTVMIMGHSYLNFRYLYNPACYFIFQLQAQLKLLQTLKQAGFTVIFKTHPESTVIIDEIMRPYCDAVERRPFEQVEKDADAFVFSYISSTTFGHALCQNKPVIALDPPYDKWVPEARNIIEKRCHFIPAFWDDNGKFDFSGDALIAALSAPKPFNLDEINEVFMPSV